MKNTTVLSLILIAVVLVSACLSRSALPPSERVFYINAIEVKGSTTTDKLAPPEVIPDSLGKTWEYKAPGVFDKANPTAWQVSAYQFNPSAITVWQGDRVKLLIFAINGNLHKDRIEGPDGQIVVPEHENNRGRQHEMAFVAEKVGIYQLRCEEHKPGMRTWITVLPRG